MIRKEIVSRNIQDLEDSVNYRYVGDLIRKYPNVISLQKKYHMEHVCLLKHKYYSAHFTAPVIRSFRGMAISAGCSLLLPALQNKKRPTLTTEFQSLKPDCPVSFLKQDQKIFTTF